LIISQKSSKRNTRGPDYNNENDLRAIHLIAGFLDSISLESTAKAAFECKAFARALMSFEQQIVKQKNQEDQQLQDWYDNLHAIYAELDEPDGMEGISTKILSPTLQNQIREHEATGRWTSAQSCWEVQLQSNPDNVSSQVGLLRCLRNLGHYG
jgi:serine/threonine-protein kinase ATR